MGFGQQDEQARKQQEEDDRFLGTAIKLLYRRGQHKAVSTLLAAESVDLLYNHDDWGTFYYDVRLAVSIDQFDELSDPVAFKEIENAYNHVWETRGREVESVALVPALVEPTWRQDVDAFLRPKVSNQATVTPLPTNAPRLDGLWFRDAAEMLLYKALKAKQEALPEAETLTIVPNPSIRVPGRTWEPDFIVVYKNRSGIIEVDGSTHRKKYASDKSRDKLLEDAGFYLIDRIDVADAEKPAEARAFVERFLARLTRQ